MKIQASNLLRALESLGACAEALEWSGKRKLSRAAYLACVRGDWFLWLAVRVGVDRKLLVLAACDCARLALPIYEARHPDDKRPRTAIETAERWACGGRRLAAAAYAAAAAAAYAAADGGADAARARTLAQCADLVRARIPYAVLREALASHPGAREVSS
jgi:hypothetical protein